MALRMAPGGGSRPVNAYKWVLLTVYALSALVSIATVGKPRKALTGPMTAVVIVLDAGMCLLVVLA
jgi:hypothetical protein